MPGGPGGFPGGPGGFPGGPGGPGGFPPPPFPGPGGPGGFPPPPFPGPGPFPPGPFPIPIPIPIPIPFPPGPGPFPPGPFPGFVTVFINGGRFFPWITNSYRVRHFPGMNIAQALSSTGVVRINNNGRIVSVNGVVITGSVDTILRLNGRRIPESLLYFPVQSGESVGLELFVGPIGTPRNDDDSFQPYPEVIENNLEALQRLEETEQQG